MAKVIGFDENSKKKVTCKECAAIIEYISNEIQTRRYSCMGDPSGHECVVCPNCGDDAIIPGTSW